ncbi:hypothetical protein MRA01_58140 [Methylobacterium radiotolerans]|nr:hypothetical protein MRA01_58140 [Methylobacterium radiotolerans]
MGQAAYGFGGGRFADLSGSTLDTLNGLVDSSEVYRCSTVRRRKATKTASFP